MNPTKCSNKKKKTKVMPYHRCMDCSHSNDSAGSDRPQRRTALVGSELARYKVEFAVLSETRLAEEGLLKEVGASYTFLWSRQRR